MLRQTMRGDSRTVLASRIVPASNLAGTIEQGVQASAFDRLFELSTLRLLSELRKDTLIGTHP